MQSVAIDCKLDFIVEISLYVGISIKKEKPVDIREDKKNIIMGIEEVGSAPFFMIWGINHINSMMVKKIIEGAATVSEPNNPATTGILVMGSKNNRATQQVFVARSNHLFVNHLLQRNFSIAKYQPC